MKTEEQEYTNESEAESEAKNHVETLRKNKFSIGAKDPNPLTQDLNHAVTCLSAELYAKDVHFLMELIQVKKSLLPSANVERGLGHEDHAVKIKKVPYVAFRIRASNWAGNAECSKTQWQR